MCFVTRPVHVAPVRASCRHEYRPCLPPRRRMSERVLCDYKTRRRPRGPAQYGSLVVVVVVVAVRHRGQERDRVRAVRVRRVLGRRRVVGRARTGRVVVVGVDRGRRRLVVAGRPVVRRPVVRPGHRQALRGRRRRAGELHRTAHRRRLVVVLVVCCQTRVRARQTPNCNWFAGREAEPPPKSLDAFGVDGRAVCRDGFSKRAISNSRVGNGGKNV